jgi:NAD(P)H-nitrite reductase large subunit
MKPKIKIAISGCPASCSNVLTTDIGIKATRSGYEIHVGGKGGAHPTVGKRIATGIDEGKVLEMIGRLLDLHDKKAGTKMRMAKLLSDPEFPFSEV